MRRASAASGFSFSSFCPIEERFHFHTADIEEGQKTVRMTGPTMNPVAPQMKIPPTVAKKISMSWIHDSLPANQSSLHGLAKSISALFINTMETIFFVAGIIFARDSREAYMCSKLSSPRQNIFHTIFEKHFTDFCNVYEDQYADRYGKFHLDRIMAVSEHFVACGRSAFKMLFVASRLV